MDYLVQIKCFARYNFDRRIYLLIFFQQADDKGFGKQDSNADSKGTRSHLLINKYVIIVLISWSNAIFLSLFGDPPIPGVFGGT
jgi:hypothetical protein